MNTRCPPKRVPSAARFFTLCRLTMQPPQSYSIGGQRSSGQLTGKPAGARPDYRGRWCACYKDIGQRVHALKWCDAASAMAVASNEVAAPVWCRINPISTTPWYRHRIGTKSTRTFQVLTVPYQTGVLHEHSAPPTLPVPLGTPEVMSADWQQDDASSIAASEEVGEQELAFPSEDVESDSMSPAVKLSLSAELMPLTKRVTAVLQVSWSTEGESKQSIFDDKPAPLPCSPQCTQIFSFSIQSSMGSLGYSSSCFQVYGHHI
ncbi:UNVERIFIED_CONTAM: hypothetical protein FKN15_043469 [Acipenser sinensis]